jgi:DNA-binding CsgD family transcriptional regulator
MSRDTDRIEQHHKVGPLSGDTMSPHSTPLHIEVTAPAALEIVDNMLKAIVASRNPDQLCTLLATDVLKDFDVIASYLAVLDNDGRITMVGSFGYPEDRRSPDDRPSLWEPMAITDTIRTGQNQIFETWQQYIDRYPHLVHRAGPGQSFVCVPFSVKGTRAGGLGLTFNRPLANSEFNELLWSILANSGDIFISQGWATGVFKSPLDATNTPDTTTDKPRQFVDTDALTERALTILKHISLGRTNREIAVALTYSESTIKQETIKLFRALGVSTREEAALAGKTLGLLKDK